MQVRESLGVERHGRLVQLINDYGRAAIQIEEVMEAVVPILGEDNDAINVGHSLMLLFFASAPRQTLKVLYYSVFCPLLSAQ